MTTIGDLQGTPDVAAPEDEFGAGILDDGEGQQPPAADESAPESDVDSAADEPPDATASEGGGEEEPASPSLIDEMRSLGFEGEMESEDAARERLLDGFRQQRDRQQALENRMRELEVLARYGQQHIADLQQQPAAASPQESPEDQKDPWRRAPEVDFATVQRYRERYQDADGQTQERWAANTPANVIADYDAHVAFQDQMGFDLTTNPQAVLQAPMEHIAEQKAIEILERYMGAPVDELQGRLDIRGEQAYQSQFEEKYSQYLFNTNPYTGKLDYDSPNDLGQKVQLATAEAAELGIADLVGQLKYAERVLQHEFAAAQGVVQSETAQNAAADRRSEKRRRGVPGGIPNSSGSVPRDPDQGPQNDHMTAGQQLLAQMKADGDR